MRWLPRSALDPTVGAHDALQYPIIVKGLLFETRTNILQVQDPLGETVTHTAEVYFTKRSAYYVHGTVAAAFARHCR